MSDTATITVAGRVFRPVASRTDGKVLTGQYNYVMAHVWAATGGKIDEALPLLLARIARSNLQWEILAGLYVADDEDGQWTVDGANKVARYFAQPHTWEDNAVLEHALMQGVADFFPGALDSTVNFDPASADPEIPATTSGDPTTSSATPSASSDPSSESSPDTIPNSSTELDAGLLKTSSGATEP